MIQIRTSVFETNSSMTHCCVIALENEFVEWKEGHLLFCNFEENFLPAYEAKERNLELLREYAQTYSELDEYAIEEYEQGKKSIYDVCCNADMSFLLFRMYLTDRQYDELLYEMNYEYWEKRASVLANPQAKIVAFGYIGDDH